MIQYSQKLLNFLEHGRKITRLVIIRQSHLCLRNKHWIQIEEG